MRVETARQFGRELVDDTKVFLRWAGAGLRHILVVLRGLLEVYVPAFGRTLGSLWRGFVQACEQGAEVRGSPESDSVKRQILRSGAKKHIASGRNITIMVVSLLALIGLFAWLVFLPVEIAGTFEGDLKLDTEGSGMAFVVPEGLYRYDFVPDQNTGVFNMHLLEVNRTDAPLINKSMSIYINGGQGTLKGSYSIKAPSFLFLMAAKSGRPGEFLAGKLFSQ